MKLIFGIIIPVVFTWVLIRNARRSTLLHSLLRIDRIVGIAAGLFLVAGYFFSLAK